MLFLLLVRFLTKEGLLLLLLLLLLLVLVNGGEGGDRHIGGRRCPIPQLGRDPEADIILQREPSDGEEMENQFFNVWPTTKIREREWLYDRRTASST